MHIVFWILGIIFILLGVITPFNIFIGGVAGIILILLGIIMWKNGNTHER